MGVVLFGSVAREEWDKHSDIDLLVIVEGWRKRRWERSRELLEVRKKLAGTQAYERLREKGVYNPIQHIPLSVREAKEFQRGLLDILMDGIILYENDNFVSQLFDRMQKKLQKMGARRVQTPDGKHYWILKDIRAGEVFEL